MLRFLLNDREVALEAPPPHATLLDHLRLDKRLCGTKEGCAEGDCGACTVLIGRPSGEGMAYEPANACIRLMPSVHATHVVTVEALAKGALHPVQQAMVETHGSQCGFCTPGIVMALYAHWRAAGAADRPALETALQGNLCRCTGYAPILEAATRALAAGGQAADPLTAQAATTAKRLNAMQTGRLTLEGPGGTALLPADVDDLAAILAERPDATIVAGATDIGVWTAKDFREISPAVFIDHLPGLAAIEPVENGLRIGAAASYADLLPWIDARHPWLSTYWRRIGGPQIRSAGTLGGNLATASPIGDTPPPLMVLGAEVTLRSAAGRRSLPIEAFITGYRETALAPGEFIESIHLPDPAPGTFHTASKISKRRDEDISSLSAAFALTLSQGRVATARIAFGGMAAQPMRAQALESSLEDRPWSLTTATAAAAALTEDFEPISDMRASASYRAAVARNLVLRAWRESTGEAASL
ncbi:MAG: xanthine dehydrogenase small subunit, partial [Pseudomonadota bacterium]